MSSAPRTCTVCSKPSELRCPCTLAFYCSKACQKGDWKAHKKVCVLSRLERNNEAEEAAVAAAAATDQAKSLVDTAVEMESQPDPQEETLLLRYKFDFNDPYGTEHSTERLSAQQMKERRAAQSEHKAEVLAKLRERVQQNGGSDREAHVRCFPHPGQKELQDSFNSVKDGWQTVPSDVLRMYLATGAPPQDMTAEQLARYKQRADVTIRETEEETAAMLEKLPPETADMLRQKMGVTQVGAILACGWLDEQMELLRVRDSLRDNISFVVGRKAAVHSEEKQWIEAINLRNGFTKTVLELQQHWKTSQ